MNAAAPPATDSSRLVQVLDDYLAAMQAGTAPDRAEFVARHPDLAGELEECLASLEFIRKAAARASPLDGGAADSASPEALGQLGDFRILREIGRGGMGVVYEAQQISLGRRVALKVLALAATLDSKQLHRFKNEAQAAAGLQHQNIVPVYAVGCERGVHYYAMQFVEGPTLADVIADLRVARSERSEGRAEQPARPTPFEDSGRATPSHDAPISAPHSTAIAGLTTERSIVSRDFFRIVARLGIQAAEALEHAHSMGVVHRDIKPANLLIESLAPALGERGRGEGVRLWITDFGLARLPTDVGLTLSSDLLGTLRYMSPEQALAKHGLVDHRTDIYSLGATLYELLTVQPVFDGRDRQELLQKIASEEPRLPSQLNPVLPTELETIVLKALAKEPEGRYAGAQELADDLRRFLDNRPIFAKRPTLLQRARKWARRHRSFVLAALVLLVVAVLGLALSTWLIWRAEQRTAAALAEAQTERQRAELRAQDTLEAVDRILHAGRLQLGAPQATGLESKALVEEALAFYLRLLEEKKTDPALRLQTARAYNVLSGVHCSLGDLAEGERTAQQSMDLLRGLITEFPAEPTYRITLCEVQRGLAGIVRSRFDRHSEAEELFRRNLDLQQALVSEFPERSDCLMQLAGTYHEFGYFHYSTGQADEAEQDYRRALELYQRAEAQFHGSDIRPQRALIYNSLGVLFRSAWRLAEAEAAHRNALNLLDEQTEEGKRQSSGERLRSLGRLAILLWWKGQQEDAERYLRESLIATEKHVTAYPRLPESRLELSLLCRQLGGLLEAAGRPGESEQLYNQAQAHQEKLVADVPASANYHLNLALTYVLQANLLAHRRAGSLETVCTKADAAFRRAMELDTKNPDVRNSYARFLANAPDAGRRNPARAVAFAKEALALAPNDRNGWNTLGMAHFRNGDAKEALAALHKSVELRYGGVCHDHFFLAMAYWKLSDKEQARHWHQRGVEWLNNTKRGREAEFARLREESATVLKLADPP